MSEFDIYRRAAMQSWQDNPRFRAIAASVAHGAMREFIERNPTADCAEAQRLAETVAATMQEALLQEDSELRAQRAIAERYKKLAEDALATSTRPPPLIISLS